MSTTSVPALLRQQIDRWAETWLKAKFTRLLDLRAQDPGPFNHPIAVFSEWRDKAFYLDVRYRSRSRKPEDDFVVRHTRMTLTGFGRFDLAYFRHTDSRESTQSLLGTPRLEYSANRQAPRARDLLESIPIARLRLAVYRPAPARGRTASFVQVL